MLPDAVAVKVVIEGAEAKPTFSIPAAPLVNPPVPERAVDKVTVPLLVKVPLLVTERVGTVRVNAPFTIAVPEASVTLVVALILEVVVQETVPERPIVLVAVVTAQTTAPLPVKFRVS